MTHGSTVYSTPPLKMPLVEKNCREDLSSHHQNMGIGGVISEGFEIFPLALSEKSHFENYPSKPQFSVFLYILHMS